MGENEASLSDFEEDEAVPVMLAPRSLSENLKAVIAELDSERQSRKLAEASLSDSESKLSRMKKQLDDARRQREEAMQSKEEFRQLLSDAMQMREQTVKQRDEALEDALKQKEEASKARDQSRLEIETVAKMLVSVAEKLAALSGESKSLSSGFSSKYTGLAAIAHGFCKRAEEIVEEVIRQRDTSSKGMNEIREQMEQRNYQIAIEVSELEASIRKLKEQVSERTSEVDRLQKLAAEKDSRVSEIRQETSKKIQEITEELLNTKNKYQSSDSKLRVTHSEVQRLREMLVEQLKNYLKTEESLVKILHRIDGKAAQAIQALPFSDYNDIEKLHEEYIARVIHVSDIVIHLENSWEEKEQIRQHEKIHLKNIVESMSEKEKEIAAFLKNTLAIGDSKNAETQSTDDDILTMANAVESDLRHLRKRVMDLEMQLTDSRAELDKVKSLSALQARDLQAKTARVRELEERDGVVSENVEGLEAEIRGAEEELERWKAAASEEAAAGVAILEEVEKCNQEIAALNQWVIQLRKSLEEANSKLQSKEEMAAAAMTARNAAERSLRVADERAGELRERLEEMSHQVDELEAKIENSRICGSGFLEFCWPWLHHKLINLDKREGDHVAAEMEELMEPLI